MLQGGILAPLPFDKRMRILHNMSADNALFNKTVGHTQVDHKRLISSIIVVLQMANDHGSRNIQTIPRIPHAPYAPIGITGEDWNELFGPLFRMCIDQLESMLFEYKAIAKSEISQHENP